jgi:hypothetical protein
MAWIPKAEREPSEIGWYKCKFYNSDMIVAIPFVTNTKGDKVWVLPDPDEIIEWEENTVNIDENQNKDNQSGGEQ